MKTRNFHDKSPQELQALLNEARAKLAQFSFDNADRKVKDTSQAKKTKREIARILTVLRTATK